MDVKEIVSSGSSSKLCHGLYERHTLYVTNCPPELYNADIRLLICVVYGYSRNSFDPVLDCVGNVWHNLNSASKVGAFSLSVNDVFVYLAGRDIVLSGEGYVEVSLVVSKVKVNFSAVVQDKNLAMPINMSACCSIRSMCTLTPWGS